MFSLPRADSAEDTGKLTLYQDSTKTKRIDLLDKGEVRGAKYHLYNGEISNDQMIIFYDK